MVISRLIKNIYTANYCFDYGFDKMPEDYRIMDKSRRIELENLVTYLSRSHPLIFACFVEDLYRKFYKNFSNLEGWILFYKEHVGFWAHSKD